MKDPGDGDKKRRWLPILSAVSATAAAVLSAYISIIASGLEASVKREISERQAETQAQIADLQEQTKRQLGETDASVRRAELFGRLIADLNDEDKSSFAILALWALYPQPEERRIVVAAAVYARRLEPIEILGELGEKFEPDVDKLLERFRRSKNDITRQRAEGLISQNKVTVILDKIDALEPAKALELIQNLPVKDANIEKLIGLRDPTGQRTSNEDVAKEMLKMAAVMGKRDDAALDAWEAAVRAAQ